jgi:hypothetical protein
MWRVMESIHCIGFVGLALRQQRRIHCLKYHISCPQALWHFDSHHKLIHWGNVIHGIVDGTVAWHASSICSLVVADLK